MQTVILPGYSPSNKEWSDLLAEKIEVEGVVRPIMWDHWLDTSQLFYPKEKANLIARHARGETINIIAKSIGTLVAAYVINQIPNQIGKVVICGIPLNDITDEEKAEIKNALQSVRTENLICFQNDNDPHGSYADVKSLIGEEINLISKPASNHEYPYYDEIKTLL
jgi:predicted alpha/beta-hydrolase family hydrolase